MAAGSSSTRLHAAARSVLRHNAPSSVSPSSIACSSNSSKGKQRQAAFTAAAFSTATSISETSSKHDVMAPCSACGSPRHASFSTSTNSHSSHVSSFSTTSSPNNSPPPPPSSSQRSNKSSSPLIRPIRVVPPRQSITATNSPVVKKPKTHSAPVKPTVDERTAEVSKSYALQAVPTTTSLAALANRISTKLLGDESGLSPSSKALDDDKEAQTISHDDWLKKIEQCCTCPSFWSVVREEERQEEIRQFHRDQARRAMSRDQQEQQLENLLTPSSSKQYTNYLDAEKLDNSDLATLGNHLLGVFAIEWLDARYPRLPTNALKAALTLYVGPRTCSDIASREWGISSGQAAKQAFLRQTAHFAPGQPLRGVGEGARSGIGLLRWGKLSDNDLKKQLVSQLSLSQQDLHQKNPTVKERQENDHRIPLPLEEALASVARAFVGLVFQEHGFIAARQFVHTNFLSRSADIASLLKFTNPKYTLSSTINKQGLPRPTTRILAETGRLSIAPIFVLGVYSGTLKLGEGYGSSLAMAEYRACEDALRRMYLSSEEEFENIFLPLNTTTRNGKKVQSPSLARMNEQDEHSSQGLPSDTIVQPNVEYQAQRPLYDDETLYQSSGKSGVVVAK